MVDIDGIADLALAQLRSELREARDENERLRATLDRVHDRLDYAGAYRPGAYMHGVWRMVDAALGEPGRRR